MTSAHPDPQQPSSLTAAVDQVNRLAETVTQRGPGSVFIAAGLIIVLLALLLDGFAKDHVIALMFGPFGGVIALLGVALIVFPQRGFFPPPPAPERKESKSAKETWERQVGLRKELEQAAKRLLHVDYEKRNLVITLDVVKVHDDEAVVRLTSDYEVSVIRPDPISFLYRAWFEVSRRATHPEVGGMLTIWRDDGAERRPIDAKLLERTSPNCRGRLYECEERINGGERRKFKWECEYEIDLPYSEFWSTSHPTRSISVVVKTHGYELDVVLHPYRDPTLAGKKEAMPVMDHGGTELHCSGLFLPFNGVFVSIVRQTDRRRMTPAPTGEMAAAGGAAESPAGLTWSKQELNEPRGELPLDGGI